MRKIHTLVISGVVLSVVLWQVSVMRAGAAQPGGNGSVPFEHRKDVSAVHLVCFASIGRVGGVDAFPPLETGVITPHVTSCAQAETILVQQGFQLQAAQPYYSDTVYFVFLKIEKRPSQW